MVVKSIPVVESAPVSGAAPLVRNDEVTPPGYEKIVKALKRGGKVANPWAVAWSMKSKGIKPKTSEGGPGSGRRPGLKHGIPKELKRMAKRSDKELAGIGASPRDRASSLNMYAKALAQHAMRRAFPQAESAPVASGQCHDELAEACMCPDCKKIENGVPSQLLHDETPKVPVKSFRDDIVRKTKLRKVMGKHEPDKDQGPVHQGDVHAAEEWSDAARAASAAARKKGWEGTHHEGPEHSRSLIMEHPQQPGHTLAIHSSGAWSHTSGSVGKWGGGDMRLHGKGDNPAALAKHLGGKTSEVSSEAVFPGPPGPIPKPFKKNSDPDEVVGDYAPGKRYSKTSEAVPSSFNDDPAGMDDTSDLDLGMLDPDNNEEIPTGDDQLWTKEEVNYRYSGDKFESCGNCVHFKFPGACEIIAGPVRPVDVCDKFEAEDEDKGEPFGWENPPEESEQIADTTVPSTLVPLKDTVQAKLVAAPKTGGYGGFGKSYGMVTADDAGGDAFGKRGMKNDDVVKSKRPSFGPASSWGMVTANDEGGPGSGRKKFAPEQPETDEDRQVATFTRRETPKQRSARIASKKVDPETAKAVRKAFASEGGPGSGRHPEGSGVVVNGTQEHPTKGPHTVFTDKVTGSTMMLPAAQATPENMAAKAIAKRREFYGDPTQRRQAMKKTARGINSESAAISALAHRLAESAFDKLKNKLAHKKGIYSPGGLAAKIGRDKYGKAGMAKKAAAGRRKTTEAPGEFMPFGPGKTAGDASGKMTYEPTQRNKKFKGLRDTGKGPAPEA